MISAFSGMKRGIPLITGCSCKLQEHLQLYCFADVTKSYMIAWRYMLFTMDLKWSSFFSLDSSFTYVFQLILCAHIMDNNSVFVFPDHVFSGFVESIMFCIEFSIFTLSNFLMYLIALTISAAIIAQHTYVKNK